MPLNDGAGSTRVKALSIFDNDSGKKTKTAA